MEVLYAIPFGWLYDNRGAVSIHSIFISFFRSFSKHRQASIEKNAEGDKKEDVSKCVLLKCDNCKLREKIMLKKLCWQLNHFLKVRNFSRGGGAHIVRANSFQGYFPRRLSLDTVVPS